MPLPSLSNSRQGAAGTRKACDRIPEHQTEKPGIGEQVTLEQAARLLREAISPLKPNLLQ
jgi:hypothetical protein